MDLSILITARNESFLRRTVEDVLLHAKGDTEIICVLDGAWAEPPLQDHARVRLIYRPEPIGQRAAINLAARMSRAKHLMKLDAHCSLDDGFDVKLMQADEELGQPDVTQIPAMNNLHVFNWRCRACGRETYQGPEPSHCVADADRDKELAVMPPACGASAGFDRVMVWEPRRKRAKGNGSDGTGNIARTEWWRFDHEMHFQYKGPIVTGQEQDEIADVMSSVGACFFMRRSRFFELDGLDEGHGSWGGFGTEIACKSWLSGGRHVVNRRTHFSHLFRTQGIGFSFPYAISGAAQDYARRYSQNLWLGNRWEKQVRPLSWMLEHFAPVIGWHLPDRRETTDAAKVRAQRLTDVMEQGHRFSGEGRCQRETKKEESCASNGTRRLWTAIQSVPYADATCDNGGMSCVISATKQPVMGVQSRLGAAGSVKDANHAPARKGLVYYSDCRGDARMLHAVRQQIQRAAPDLPLVSVTLQPLEFGRNIVLPLERGYLTMFRQILTGLEALDTDIAFLVEHDVLYSPEHFQFMPERSDRFYYNQHRWQVSAESGHAVHYRCGQTSGLCANRELLIAHYRERIAAVEAAGGYQRNMGFEPGTNKWSLSIDPHGAEFWFSTVPNIDIRHGSNLSKTRWSQDQFHNKSTCQGWTEGTGVPGWGQTEGRFWEFLASVGQSENEGAA